MKSTDFSAGGSSCTIRNNTTILITIRDIITESVPLAMAQLAIRERSSSEVPLNGKKTGNSLILSECTNQVEINTPTSVINTPSVGSTPADSTNFLTPTSHFPFQDFQKAERSLEDGQKLIQCRRCRVDLNDSNLSCKRRFYSPRRICSSNSQLDSSHFSDSGVSEGDSLLDFSNMVLSPTETSTASLRHSSDRCGSSNSIERIRDFGGSCSDGALSLSSYSHLQRSDQSLNFSNYDVSVDSAFANVLECPNPNCGYRFCSNCEESEHPGRQCYVVSSEQFESSLERNNNISGNFGETFNNISNNNSQYSDNSNSKSTSNKKSSKQKKQKKSLRRLARLL